jgi:hypothetical protein
MRFAIGSIIAVPAIAALVIAGCSKQSPTTQAIAPPVGPSVSGPFKPVATVKQVMQGITIPASNAVFAVAGTAPTDDAGWQAVEASALAVAESANLLLMKPRAVDEQQWRQFSLALVDAAVRAAEAARAHDADKTSTAGDDMYNTCEQCHAQYQPKP